MPVGVPIYITLSPQLWLASVRAAKLLLFFLLQAGRIRYPSRSRVDLTVHERRQCLGTGINLPVQYFGRRIISSCRMERERERERERAPATRQNRPCFQMT